MVQESGEKKDIAQKEAAKFEVKPEDMKFSLPEQALVVDPFRVDALGRSFPAEKRAEVERKIDSTILPFLGPGRHIQVKIVGAADYLDHTKQDEVIYQVSVWKRRPYRASVEAMHRKGIAVDASRMEDMGYDHEKEMNKSRWEAAWSYGPRKLKTDDVQIGVDAVREIVNAHETFVDVVYNVQRDIQEFLSQPPAIRAAALPSWIIEESLIVSPSAGLGGTIRNFMGNRKEARKEKRAAMKKSRKKNRGHK
jgi:hypothetical protein